MRAPPYPTRSSTPPPPPPYPQHHHHHHHHTCVRCLGLQARDALMAEFDANDATVEAKFNLLCTKQQAEIEQRHEARRSALRARVSADAAAKLSAEEERRRNEASQFPALGDVQQLLADVSLEYRPSEAFVGDALVPARGEVLPVASTPHAAAVAQPSGVLHQSHAAAVAVGGEETEVRSTLYSAIGWVRGAMQHLTGGQAVPASGAPESAAVAAAAALVGDPVAGLTPHAQL
jgi:hypothetical protein